MDGTAFVQCSNCLFEIPEQNLVVHQTHCSRNLRICTLCNKVVNKADWDLHKETHDLITCSMCGENLKKGNLEEHLRTSCVMRNSICKYCELDLREFERMDHELYCGNRTDFCSSCKRYVKLSDLEEHNNTNCKYPVQPTEQTTKITDIETKIDRIRLSALRTDPSMFMYKCDHCNLSFVNKEEYESHNLNDCTEHDDMHSISSTIMIPCEICESLISVDKVVEHQFACKVIMDRTHHLRDLDKEIDHDIYYRTRHRNSGNNKVDDIKLKSVAVSKKKKVHSPEKEPLIKPNNTIKLNKSNGKISPFHQQQQQQHQIQQQQQQLSLPPIKSSSISISTKKIATRSKSGKR